MAAACAWSRMSASCPSLLASPSPQRTGKRRRFATGGVSSAKAAGSGATFGFLQARPSIIIAQHIVRFVGKHGLRMVAVVLFPTRLAAGTSSLHSRSVFECSNVKLSVFTFDIFETFTFED